jgi:hypothetical protein
MLTQITDINFETRQGAQRFTASDAIYDKTASDPIPQGAKIGGWLCYSFEGHGADDRNSDNRFELGFNDVFGKRYIVVTPPGALRRDEFMYIPDGSGGMRWSNRE